MGYRGALALFASAGVLAAGAAHAQDTRALQVASLAATCANCHGTQGKPVAGSPLPALAGMPKDAMLASLRGFKDGSRPATIMHQLTKGYSDAQLEQIATYFAGQPR
jgi:cytochrome c553